MFPNLLALRFYDCCSSKEPLFYSASGGVDGLSFASYCDVPGQGNSGREQLREACDSNSRVQCLQFREKNKKPN
jgi:hypothetical protein